jgi:hypothetical protein
MKFVQIRIYGPLAQRLKGKAKQEDRSISKTAARLLFLALAHAPHKNKE